MGRRKPPGLEQGYRKVTVTLDPDTAQHLDQMMMHLGLESRGGTLLMLIQAQLSATPLDSLEFSAIQTTLRLLREQETSWLAQQYEQRIRSLRVPV